VDAHRQDGVEKRVCGRGDVVLIPSGVEHEAWFREDTEVIDLLCASARGLPDRRQAIVHERRLNTLYWQLIYSLPAQITVGREGWHRDMSEEHARIRHLKEQWDDEDAMRDERERRARQLVLEEHANQIFAPIEDFLARLDKVLRAVGGSVEIDARWEHLGDQKLRRVATVYLSTFRRSPLPSRWSIGSLRCRPDVSSRYRCSIN
jgi:hypothetical protein